MLTESFGDAQDTYLLSQETLSPNIDSKCQDADSGAAWRPGHRPGHAGCVVFPLLEVRALDIFVMITVCGHDTAEPFAVHLLPASCSFCLPYSTSCL